MKDLLQPSLAALAIQPLVFSALMVVAALSQGEAGTLTDLPALAMFVLAVAFFHLVFLGLPAFLLLRKFTRPNWLNMALLGAVVGSIVAGLFSWPTWPGSQYSYAATWQGEFTPLVVDGAVTKVGWLQYLEGLLFFAVHGLAGGTAFYIVWRKHAA